MIGKLIIMIGVPLTSQSDPGTENNGVANCQTHIRQLLDPTLAGTLQHQWRWNKTNVKPEAFWSYLRRHVTPGFEDVLEFGMEQRLYDPSIPLHKLLFRWLVIPWLQREFDKVIIRFNASARRRDKHKILPQGIPDLIARNPERYGYRNYTVGVSPEIFSAAEAQWAPPDDPVFQLTPQGFDVEAKQVYNRLGSPSVTHDSVWMVYTQMLAILYQSESLS
ncbi:hypothetical protein HDZ31DRAFT_70735 [Schizophyllum fasciatum]